MPQVVVTIAEKTYRMACGEGEEAHLTALAAAVDGRIRELSGSFGGIGELGLTVMAAMMTTDDLDAAKRRIAQLERQIEERSDLSVAIANARRAEREKFAEALDAASETIERIGDKLVAETGGGLRGDNVAPVETGLLPR